MTHRLKTLPEAGQLPSDASQVGLDQHVLSAPHQIWQKMSGRV